MSRAASEEVIAGRAAISVNDPGTDVPEGWSRVRLTDIARLESGHTPSRKHPEWWGGDIPWVSLPDARDHHGGVIHDTTQKTNELGLANSAARLLPKDTVCLSRTASVGYVFRMGRPMATSQDFVNWVCSDALDPRFLQQALLAEGKHLLNFGMGTTHTTIYFPAVLAFHINLAPLPEQRRIVTQVEALLEQVNRAKGRLDRVPLILKRFRQAVLEAACSGRFTTSPTEDGELPSGWSESSLEDLAEPGGIFDGARDHGAQTAVAQNLRTVDYTDSGVRVIRLENLAHLRFVEDKRTFISESKYAGLVQNTIREGDILFGSFVEEEVRVCVFPKLDVPAIAKADCFCIRTKAGGYIDHEYLAFQLATKRTHDSLVEEVHGATRPRITTKQLKKVVVPVCPRAEQRAIVAIVRRHFALADAIERRVLAATARANKLPEAILSKAFSGELVPTEAELARAEARTYETAEELLKRVSASAPTAGTGAKARRPRTA